MSVQWSGMGEGKDIREEQIGDSHHKRQSPPVPDGELQSLLLREGPQSKDSGDVGDFALQTPEWHSRGSMWHMLGNTAALPVF